MLGNIKNETTTPQVELLFRKRPYLSTADLYINRSGLYFPQTGNEGVPMMGNRYTSSGSGEGRCREGYMAGIGTMSPHWVPEEGCQEGQYCNHGVCHPIPPDDWGGDGVEIGWHECGSLGEVDATGRSVPIHLGGSSWGAMKPDTIGTGNSIYIPSGWDVVWHEGGGFGEWDWLALFTGTGGTVGGSLLLGSVLTSASLEGTAPVLAIGGSLVTIGTAAGGLLIWYYLSTDDVYRNEECTIG